ncbi:hypothetical protein [Allomuricauda sp. d1]|uniref:hypothetical protein n=1 Tax=Allomuricauda sp. d1 TaxID=3136725 RepID=UPI0031D04BAC
MKNFLLPFIVIFFMAKPTMSQDSTQVVVAEDGDGIFSILRKEGMNPSKYYADFVALNEPNIRNGSELHVGREYKLPDAPDSFKNIGRHITVPANTDHPIFEGELAKMNLKSSKLSRAVYYLISEGSESASNSNPKKFPYDITRNLAKRLLENGARVYIIERTGSEAQVENTVAMQDYVDAINKRFLRHAGKYQRLLLVSGNGLTSHKNLDVSIFHHGKSIDGQRLADNIQSVFQKNGIKKMAIGESSEIFEDKDKVFLAKNTLPALTVVKIGSTDEKTDRRTLSVRPDNDALAKWLTNGIFKDYADLEIED